MLACQVRATVVSCPLLWQSRAIASSYLSFFPSVFIYLSVCWLNKGLPRKCAQIGVLFNISLVSIFLPTCCYFTVAKLRVARAEQAGGHRRSHHTATPTHGGGRGPARLQQASPWQRGGGRGHASPPPPQRQRHQQQYRQQRPLLRHCPHSVRPPSVRTIQAWPVWQPYPHDSFRSVSVSACLFFCLSVRPIRCLWWLRSVIAVRTKVVCDDHCGLFLFVQKLSVMMIAVCFYTYKSCLWWW